MESEETKLSKHTVHHVLAHSYLVYFVLLLIGVFLDFTFGYDILHTDFALPIGCMFLILATIIIFWAQKTGRDFSKIKEDKKIEHFCRGPYCYTRVPTQWGLFFLVLGFGLIINSLFIVVFTVVSFVISKTIFIGKHDKILIEKYGEAYAGYKKLVKF